MQTHPQSISNVQHPYVFYLSYLDIQLPLLQQLVFTHMYKKRERQHTSQKLSELRFQHVAS